MLLFVSAVSALTSPIQIDRRPPTVQRIVFDPARPPADMPRLDAGEAATCQFNFQCGARFQSVTEQQIPLPGGRVRAVVKIESMAITLTLENRIFLPRDATAKLRAHEEGHREINERVYESAEAVARAEAQRVLGQTWEGEGESADAAAQAALQQALRSFCRAYHAQIADRAYRVGSIYDELTDHGRRLNPTEREAIDLAFNRADREAGNHDPGNHR